MSETITREQFKTKYNGKLENLMAHVAVMNSDVLQHLKVKITPKKRYYVGIDAGVQTGFAVYDREKKEVIFKGTSNFWSVFNLISNFQKPEDTVILIEKPKKNFVYPQRAQTKTSLVRERIAFNSGENNREATLLIEGFERLGFEVIPQVPESAKWTASDLKRYTGITERTSSHCRDAIKLCFGV